jgi:arginine decarboxylase-like protein
VNEFSAAQHDDAVADLLNLVENVRREQHRLPALACFADLRV